LASARNLLARSRYWRQLKELPVIRSLLFSLALLGASGAALAQALAVQQSGDVQYVTGGIGDEERAAFDEARKAFNLELIFAAKGGGEYLSGLDVVIQDKSGREVLKTHSEGPRLLARVPPGSYKVTALYDGMPQTRTVTAPAQGTRTVPLYWRDASVGEGNGMEPRPSRGASR
jgi:hypothetical protein